MSSIFSYFFAGEKLSKFDLIGIFVSLLGVIIISNPDFFKSENTENAQNEQKMYPFFGFGVISALAGSTSSGLAYLWMRKIGQKIHVSLLPMYFGIFTTFFSVLVLAILEIFPIEEFKI